jgi:hypothetical protein
MPRDANYMHVVDTGKFKRVHRRRQGGHMCESPATYGSHSCTYFRVSEDTVTLLTTSGRMITRDTGRTLVFTSHCASGDERTTRGNQMVCVCAILSGTHWFCL